MDTGEYIPNDDIHKSVYHYRTLSTTNTLYARNTIINFVPQQEAWVIERMGKFHKILEPVCSFVF